MNDPFLNIWNCFLLSTSTRCCEFWDFDGLEWWNIQLFYAIGQICNFVLNQALETLVKFCVIKIAFVEFVGNWKIETDEY